MYSYRVLAVAAGFTLASSASPLIAQTPVDGTITTLAGTGTPGFNGEGPAASATVATASHCCSICGISAIFAWIWPCIEMRCRSTFSSATIA